MNQTVIGVFDTAAQAKEAQTALQTATFTNVDTQTFGESGRYDDRYASATDSVYAFFGNLFDTDEETAKGYAEVARRGTVVTVYTDTMEDAKKAAAILDQYGAIDFDERRTAYAGYEGKDLNDDTIKVIQENIAVGKREVQTGATTVRSRIIEKPVVEELRLRAENVYVTRTPVNRVATAADFADATGTITMTETAEEAVVAKEARVVEEIAVGKEVTTRTETINETIRETEVDVVETAGEIVKEYNATK
ncbi:YsnF/AvaK domain-containing protein [Lewinella sp. 4G2]|uniref:YsnF/AvaK domain-containing protein n=1 Tax=Lewinella sp. 4G2 TaxID=1803372 RepID=UPI0007B48A5E|nr:YsnF/AvaK domain-containing protein [Lewinella sp. 4G2]OAV42795.1 hypothetical protein A3850_016295 [Lewinella sp. 4G2]